MGALSPSLPVLTKAPCICQCSRALSYPGHVSLSPALPRPPAPWCQGVCIQPLAGSWERPLPACSHFGKNKPTTRFSPLQACATPNVAPAQLAVALPPSAVTRGFAVRPSFPPLVPGDQIIVVNVVH